MKFDLSATLTDIRSRQRATKDDPVTKGILGKLYIQVATWARLDDPEDKLQMTRFINQSRRALQARGVDI